MTRVDSDTTDDAKVTGFSTQTSTISTSSFKSHKVIEAGKYWCTDKHRTHTN